MRYPSVNKLVKTDMQLKNRGGRATEGYMNEHNKFMSNVVKVIDDISVQSDIFNFTPYEIINTICPENGKIDLRYNDNKIGGFWGTISLSKLEDTYNDPEIVVMAKNIRHKTFKYSSIGYKKALNVMISAYDLYNE